MKRMKRRIIDKQLTIRRIFILICDICIIIFSGVIGLLLRFDLMLDKVDPRFIESLWRYMPINIILTITVFYLFRLYHSLWIYASITEMQNVFSACFSSFLSQIIGMELLGYSIPIGYYFLYGGALLLFTVGSRFAYRFIRVYVHRHQKKTNNTNIMIIGAGDAANVIIKEISSSKHIHNSNVKCIIDDAIEKRGRFIQGIKVVGTRKNIIECVTLYHIDEIIIAMPSVTKKVISEVVDICKETNCSLKILPGIYQFMTGEVSVSKLRKVEVEDLLGRDSIKVDINSIMGYVKGKVVLITGGGGSIGSELCRQIAGHQPSQLIIVDIYENNAYDIQQELKKKFPVLNLLVLIASVRNSTRMYNAPRN